MSVRFSVQTRIAIRAFGERVCHETWDRYYRFGLNKDDLDFSELPDDEWGILLKAGSEVWEAGTGPAERKIYIEDAEAQALEDEENELARREEEEDMDE